MSDRDLDQATVPNAEPTTPHGRAPHRASGTRRHAERDTR